jgi:ADP-L-glycero-D-manno-heptose 6-epimerase
MKILVTGSRGFIGQNLIQYLSLDHTLEYFEWGDRLPDIAKYQWVIHLGAITSTIERDVEKIMSQNYDFSHWILDRCLKYNVNLQYSSSASVYGLSREFREDGHVDPRSPYAWSKYLFDRDVTKLLTQKNLNIRIQGFRYFNVYGPHEDHKHDQASPFHKFRQQAITTGVIKLFYGSHHYHRDFVSVEQVCDIHEKFLNIDDSGIWNVGTGNTRNFQSIADEVAKDTGARIEYVEMPESIRSQYQVYTCADLTKLNKTLKNSRYTEN